MKIFTEDTFNYTDAGNELAGKLDKDLSEIAATLDNPRELHALVNSAVAYAVSYEVLKRNMKRRAAEREAKAERSA